MCVLFFFFFQAEDGIRDSSVTGVQTCALPISHEAPLGPAGTHDHFDLQTSKGLLRLHDPRRFGAVMYVAAESDPRSEEHTSELQSHLNLVCRLLLEKKKTIE